MRSETVVGSREVQKRGWTALVIKRRSWRACALFLSAFGLCVRHEAGHVFAPDAGLKVCSIVSGVSQNVDAVSPAWQDGASISRRSTTRINEKFAANIFL